MKTEPMDVLQMLPLGVTWKWFNGSILTVQRDVASNGHLEVVKNRTEGCILNNGSVVLYIYYINAIRGNRQYLQE
jgi:hypothetical protein